MGLHFYLKSLFAVTIVSGLVLLTWNKATEIVREFAEVHTVTVQGKDGVLSGREVQYNVWKVVKKDTFDKTGAVGMGKLNNTDRTQATTTSVASLSTDSFTTDSMSSEDESDHAYASSSTTTRSLSSATTTPTEETRSKTATASTAAPTNEYFKTETNKHEYENTSSEKHHVAFLKVHKTGSSTVQNIFLRFGDSRNLTFILAHDDKDKAETKFPNMISYSNSLNERNIVPPPHGRHFEMLCCHVIYNRTQFEKYLPEDTSYIGLVREPIVRLESSFRYFNLYPNVSLSDFADNPLLYDRGLHSMSNNRMSFEFGFPLKLFPNSKENVENLQQEIGKYIDKLKNEFDLIMINVKMDESLVLMKRVLNWHIKDIMYMEQLVARHETRRFSDTDIKKLKSYLYLDFALYQAAMTELDTAIAKLGKDFIDEVNHFKQEKAKIQDFCKRFGERADLLSFESSKWDSAYTISQHDCEMYKKFEIKFIQDIRMRQYGKLGI